MSSIFPPEEISSRQWVRGGLRPVLAIHCSLAHSGAFAWMADRLEGVTLTAIDLPGHGRARDWSGEGDIHDLATAQARALAERLGEGGAIDLIGHSFGATVALRLALEAPHLVRSLVLIEPPLFAALGAGLDYATHQEIDDLIRRDPEAGARAFHALWGDGQPLADLPERARRYIVERIALVSAQGPTLVEDRAGLLASGGLEGLRIPVLLLEGEKSPPAAAQILDALEARLPQVTRERIAGAGHMLPLTHYKAVAQAVMAHLARGKAAG